MVKTKLLNIPVGDFGKCVICGEEYTIYGEDNICDNCGYDIDNIQDLTSLSPK